MQLVASFIRPTLPDKRPQLSNSTPPVCITGFLSKNLSSQTQPETAVMTSSELTLYSCFHRLIVNWISCVKLVGCPFNTVFMLCKTLQLFHIFPATRTIMKMHWIINLSDTPHYTTQLWLLFRSSRSSKCFSNCCLKFPMLAFLKICIFKLLAMPILFWLLWKWSIPNLTLLIYDVESGHKLGTVRVLLQRKANMTS